ncbi:MAG: DUF4394 domain-containing protein [Fimbriimonadaceae bacterium]
MHKSMRLPIVALLVLSLSGCNGGSGDGGADIWAVTSTNALIKFDINESSDTDTSVNITGLQPGESILGIDFRPSTGQIYALGSTSRLYTINAQTGAATQVGGVLDVTLNGSAFGFDFNPVSDRIRVVSDAEQNFRIDPDTGAVIDFDPITPGVQPDADLNPLGEGVGLAYTNNFANATVTTAFVVDASTDGLLRLGGVDGSPSPDFGLLTGIGNLGFDLGANAGFDIDSSGMAVIVHNSGPGQNDVYTVNLLTGQASFVGTAAAGATITSMAVRG